MKLTRLHRGFIVLAFAAPLWGQFGGFGGPSILSRDDKASGKPPGGLSLRPFLSLQGSYSFGLTDFDTGISRDYYGFGVSFGFGVDHATEHSAISGGYYGNTSYYPKQHTSPFHNINQGVSIGYSRQLSRQWGYFLGVSGSMRSNILGGDHGVQPSNLPQVQLPDTATDYIDTRSYSAGVSTGATYQATRRLSVSFSAGSNLAQYQRAGLIGGRGAGGNISAFYLLSASQGVGVSYSYSFHYFPGGYGESQNSTASAFYSRALTSSWRFDISSGVYRSHVQRLSVVPIDPIIARYTGQANTLQLIDHVRRGISGSLALSGDLHGTSIGARYNRGITPGNGLLLTSVSDRLTLYWSLKTTLNSGFGLSAGATKNSSLLQTIQPARAYQAGAHYSYRISDYIHFSANLGWMRTRFPGSDVLSRHHFMATAGISFAPGSYSLTMW